MKQIQALVRRAATATRSTADPVEDATEYVQRHLQVKVSDESHVLSLQFQAAKADKASVVVNGIMAEYISADTAARRAQALEVSQWFTSCADVALQELRAARLRIQNYAQAHNSPQVQGSSVAALQLSKDQADLAVARQTVARQQAALETIKRMGVRGDSTQAGAETLGSPTIQALQKLEAQTQLKLAPFGPNDPRKAQLEHGLNSIHQRISDETKRIIASLERERDITHAHVVELEKAVQGATDKARDASVAELSLAALTSDAEAAKQRYENLLGRAEATKLASAQLPSARIISYAVPAHRPVFSRGVLDAISVLMGFIVGASLATSILLLKNILRTKITSRLDLATTTDLSVVGCLPETKSMIALGQSPVHVTETLRAVWLAIRSRASKDGGSTIVVTSSEAGEGKTTVAATLARRVASDGFRALLVDGDMRRPQLSAALKLRIVHSLESVLGGVVDFESQ